MTAFYSAQVRMQGDVFDPGRVDSESKAVYRQQLTASGLFLEGELRRATPIFTGAASKAWFTEVWPDHVIVANPQEYLPVLELGRRAAPVPIKPLILWSRRKFSVDEKTAKRIAFFIARKKKRQPTPGLHFAQKTFDDSVETINTAFLQPIGVELIRRLSL